MQEGKFNVILDGFWGSSGKGKVAAYLADKYKINHVSSSNFPNAGHTVRFDSGYKFVSKAIPAALALHREKGVDMIGYVSPSSGFHIPQILKEISQTGGPDVYVHDRANIVSERHAKEEKEGAMSTKHLASTMQGSGAALAEKIMRIEKAQLAGTYSIKEYIEMYAKDSEFKDLANRIHVIDGRSFRELVWGFLSNGGTWLHEGSQGYALSIDHGSHYPYCTSRNCTVQKYMDDMTVPANRVGDVYINIRPYPIRVGNVIENGVEVGFSGDFYHDCQEISWEEVAKRAGIPDPEELKNKEFTTVTGRLRRVSTFSYDGLRDAVMANGATKLVMNFIQYVNYKDMGLRGGKEAFDKLSSESRKFIEKVEEVSGVPVVLIGTGANHEDMIDIT